MRRAYWRLKYDPEVVAKLYQMRERGIAVRAAIKELSFQREPWTGSLVTGERSGWYEFVVREPGVRITVENLLRGRQSSQQLRPPQRHGRRPTSSKLPHR